MTGETETRRLAWIGLPCLAAVAVLWSLTRWTGFVAVVDQPASDFFRALGGRAGDALAVAVSARRYLVVVAVVLIGGFVAFDHPRWKAFVVTLVVVALLHALLNEVLLKGGLGAVGLARVRPYLATGSEGLGTTIYADSSFPSSHMTGIVAVFTVLVLFVRRAWPLAVVATLLMAFARLHAGMHYPSDVVAGTLLGVAYALVAAWLVVRGSAFAPVRRFLV